METRSEELIERWAYLPTVDANGLPADIDLVADTSATTMTPEDGESPAPGAN